MLGVREQASRASYNSNTFQLQLSYMEVQSPSYGQRESNENYITFNIASFLGMRKVCVKCVFLVTFALFFSLCFHLYPSEFLRSYLVRKLMRLLSSKREGTASLGLI